MMAEVPDCVERASTEVLEGARVRNTAVDAGAFLT